MRETTMASGKIPPSTEDSRQSLDRSISAATDALLAAQRPDGHWLFELEADATIPAEYVLLRHYLGEPVDAELEGKIANYLRRIQAAHDGWPLFYGGDFDMSASVKAYFALKMIGDDPEAAHMRRAREAIRERGGAAQEQRLHTGAAGAIRRRQLAGGSRDAGRDHAVALLVSAPSQQDVLLGAHGHRAAAGVGRPEAASAQSEKESASTNSFSSRRNRSACRPRRRIRAAPGRRFSPSSTPSCASSNRIFPSDRASGRSTRR